VVRYWPNPAHKSETTEAGPPRWRPGKDKCPQMTVEERNLLLSASLPVNAEDPRSRRVAWRRHDGRVEFYDVKYTRDVDGVPEFHGHPASRVDSRVLRELRAQNAITEPEYRRLLRELPGC
jgi:hypothetical protein